MAIDREAVVTNVGASGSRQPCPPRPELLARPLISADQTERLAGLFKLMASETRLRILHAIARGGELCVGELAEEVSMQTQAVSNQLRLMLDRGFVAARRRGNNVYYQIVNLCVEELLEHGLCLIDCEDERAPDANGGGA